MPRLFSGNMMSEIREAAEDSTGCFLCFEDFPSPMIIAKAYEFARSRNDIETLEISINTDDPDSGHWWHVWFVPTDEGKLHFGDEYPDRVIDLFIRFVEKTNR